MIKVAAKSGCGGTQPAPNRIQICTVPLVASVFKAPFPRQALTLFEPAKVPVYLLASTFLVFKLHYRESSTQHGPHPRHIEDDEQVIMEQWNTNVSARRNSIPHDQTLWDGRPWEIQKRLAQAMRFLFRQLPARTTIKPPSNAHLMCPDSKYALRICHEIIR